MHHETGQGTEKSLKLPIHLEYFRDKSDYLNKDVIKCWRQKVYLDNQRCRENISLYMALVVVAIISVSFQALRAAMANPADSLRYE